jgi:hypothetical protein
VLSYRKQQEDTNYCDGINVIVSSYQQNTVGKFSSRRQADHKHA